MSKIILNRRLWYTDQLKAVRVDQRFLERDERSLILLGEAGMGKSTLLENLSDQDGYALYTARRLINTPNLAGQVEPATTLVIDALDEVSAGRDGDAVDLVLRQLVAIGCPRFILSCRVADWRSATALQGFRDFYAAAPLELHIEPLDRDDAFAFLASSLDVERAEKVLRHLESRGLAGLWSNPQTLELLARVGAAGELPNSKGDLFDTATKLLCAEHRKEKSGTALAQLSEKEVLDAAGAGFAALILAGQEALSLEIDVEPADLAVRELKLLEGAGDLPAALDSRLFLARGPERFTYAHRAIGEFLGARWLARITDTDRKRRRLFELLNGHALVPASLRGIHAWLAWHSLSLAPEVIARDPMGIVEYGDADRLDVIQARALLQSLETLSREDPSFRTWTEYRVSGIVQPALVPELRRIITAPDVEFGLRLLVLQALKGSQDGSALCDVLENLLLDSDAIFACRSEAGDRLVEFEAPLDWPDVVQRLRDQNDDSGVRLAIELLDEVGYDRFSDELILDVVLAQLARTERTAGVFFSLTKKIPVERVAALLDGISVAARKLGNRHERASNSAITDLAFGLIARRLNAGGVEAHRLWAWLEPFAGDIGYQREVRVEVAEALAADDPLRRGVQRHVLLDTTDGKTVWQRAWRLTERTSGLRATEEDVILLLGLLESDDERWRDIVQLVQHSAAKGDAVREVAMRFVANDPEGLDWLTRLPEPRIYDWQIEEEERRQREEATRNAEWAAHRANFAEHIDALRAGDYGAVINPAKAYLNLFHDIGEDATDWPGRLTDWLGPALCDASLTGFEAFLRIEPPMPTATQIAESHAQGSQWDAGFIVVAALAERVRTGQGLADLSDERLMAGLFELRSTGLDSHAGVPALSETIAQLLRERSAWEETQRLYIEPQLEQRQTHVDGLYALMREDRDANLACSLAEQWLQQFPDIPENPEFELIDRLLPSSEYHALLRELSRERRAGSPSDERRRTWEAVGLIVDFENTRIALEARGPIEPALFWHLRARLGDRRHQGSAWQLEPAQLGWVIATFRGAFAAERRPTTVTTGDTNPWDATDYISALINRLGNQTSDSAISILAALRDAPADGYTDLLRNAAAEQRRRRVEADWRSPSLATITSAVMDVAPDTAAQLQAVLLEELGIVQAKIRGSDVDWYKDFFEDGVPRVEDDCRDVILKMLQLPFGIKALPEGHLADDKRSDIICLLDNLMVPIEVKGQWHAKVWTAADQQLDALYINDWRAERGIYLVLWFGTDSAKAPTKAPEGVAQPTSAADLQRALTDRSATTRQGRTEVVVLDLTRPG